MPKSKIVKKEKKERKNVYIKESQIQYILKKCGGDGNFSPYLSKMIDLSMALIEDEILKDLTDEEIKKFVASELLDKRTQQLRLNKVLEYGAVFEQMADHLRYFVPDIEKAIELRIPLLEQYSMFDIKSIRPRQLELFARMVRENNIVEKFDYIIGEKDLAVLTLSGKNPASLEWYSKILLLTISYFKSNWQLKEYNKSISGTDIRIVVRPGSSQEEARQKIIEYFSNPEMMVNDENGNSGIWNNLNDHFNIIIDNEYLKSILNKDEIGSEIVPYKSIVDSLKNQDKNRTISNIFKFYEKLHLVSFLTFNKGKKHEIKFYPNIEIVEDMLKKTFDYLKIKYEIKKYNEYLVFSSL
ncbi:MAG: hypothetical protein EAX96_18990 [Candidatus Lokiarchaeota archaeon]|nr:hypothetical protein [Candidatus Lokiarchaeota archaeon]